jgi:hypothetical protein
MENEFLIVKVVIDEEFVGVFDPLRKCMTHRGWLLPVKVATHHQVFEIFRSFYGSVGELQSDFAQRFQFVPYFPASENESPF